MRNVKFTEEFAKLTVAQAHKAFFRAVEDADMARADALRHFLRLASTPLREALDEARAIIHKVRVGRLDDEALEPAQIAQRNLLRDLDLIKAVIDWKPEALAPRPTLGEALALAGLKAGERA